MTYFLLTLAGLLLGAFGGFWVARRLYFSRIKADKTAKILGFAEKKHLEAKGERVVKLDFESLLKDMETHYRLWTGHKHNVRLGMWINWIKTIVNKDGNTNK